MATMPMNAAAPVDAIEAEDAASSWSSEPEEHVRKTSNLTPLSEPVQHLSHAQLCA
jgi:hypothetical protein